jgi:hypothetical protein
MPYGVSYSNVCKCRNIRYFVLAGLIDCSSPQFSGNIDRYMSDYGRGLNW